MKTRILAVLAALRRAGQMVRPRLALCEGRVLNATGRAYRWARRLPRPLLWMVFAVALGVGAGATTFLLLRRNAAPVRPQTVDLVTVRQDIAATPGLDSASRAQTAAAAPPDTVLRRLSVSGDWADSVPVPPWVARPTTFTRPYQPLGRYTPSSPFQLGVTRSAPAVSRAGAVSPSAAPAPPPAAGLLVRIQGRDAAVANVSVGRGAFHPPPRSTLRLVGDCGRSVGVGRSADDSVAPVYATGGDWLFALATADTLCEIATRRSFSRSAPPAALRRSLAVILTRAAGQPFRPGDIAEVVLSPSASDGTRWAWGVARQRPEGTQMSPPPPLPEIAFVARGDRRGGWSIAWSRYTDDPDARLGLAGVYDGDGDRVPEAHFGVRLGDRVEYLRVVPVGGGRWDVRATSSFHLSR